MLSNEELLLIIVGCCIIGGGIVSLFVWLFTSDWYKQRKSDKYRAKQDQWYTLNRPNFVKKYYTCLSCNDLDSARKLTALNKKYCKKRTDKCLKASCYECPYMRGKDDE